MTPAAKTVELEISGMSCGGCVRGVTAALSGVAGVSVQQVVVGKAVIAASSDDVVSGAVAAISAAGFQVRNALLR